MKTNLDDADPDLSKVKPLPLENSRASVEFKRDRRRARAYLESHSWISAIKGEYLGYRLDGVIYVFLFEFIPAEPNVPSWTWVIVGDLPSAYISCHYAKTPYVALDGYIGAMEEWVEAAREGKSVEDIIPVNVPATPEYAERLGGRLNFLRKNVLPLLRK
ncbi:hypothetical protein ASD99_28180 [Mesorhizobium sp. Root695]|jgi:hypothetical protein|uniref:hypothetical protein n=1 Tax=unclassified Mesorhizobium TaxID=325217 RepID=UPI0006FE992D|nr:MULTISPECIES: hypothetical protein [unclassified Mesorhizobium]KQU83447.1 hypothetical protein ASD12_10605 [Mesorhizobium sp. Root102]KRB25658.1 hypothetical protein ASD99_28180 [Mesorhizobium sp. Root695]